MKTKIVEATNGSNWGKFLVGQFDATEIARQSVLTKTKLLATCGWWSFENYCWVLDLQTGEGGLFKHGGLASADLNKHKIWVCPLFEPFLEWLYARPLNLETLPELVELPNAEFALYGYRRPGQEEKKPATK